MRGMPSLLVAVLVCTASGVRAQEAAQSAPDPNAAAVQKTPDQPAIDGRTQYPKFMENSFFTFSVGMIGYRFNQRQLEAGFQAESIDYRRLAVRVDLFGHRFTKHLSAQAVYMRPAWFVQYNNINGTTDTRQVSNAYAGVTLAVDVPITSKLSAFGEGGGGITSRSGVIINGAVALNGAHYTSGMLGAGLDIQASRTLDLMLSATYLPGRESFAQPSTRMFTAGLRYHMRPVPDAAIEENRSSGYVFPANMIRVGFTTNVLGYAMNGLFSKRIPIFWGGRVDTRHGATIDYQRNVFHTKKVFAFDLGASGSTVAERWHQRQLRDDLWLPDVPVLLRPLAERPTSTSITRSPDRPSSRNRSSTTRTRARGSRSRISWASARCSAGITGSTRKSASSTTPTATCSRRTSR